MELSRWNPRCAVPRKHREFSSLIDDFFSPVSVRNSGVTNSLAPSVDIYERDKIVIINAELPGFRKEDITVDVKGKTLTFGGERKEDENLSTENFYRKERRYGKFQRSFNLGFELTTDAINATYERGILTLEISKPLEQEKKQIHIH